MENKVTERIDAAGSAAREEERDEHLLTGCVKRC
jgi:hypothetical protein